MKIGHRRLTPAPAHGEAYAKANSATNCRHDRDVLHLIAGKRSTPARPLVVAHLDTQRTQPDLGGFFRPGHLAGQTVDHQADQQKREQVGSPQHLF
jgi:hypothetical protein